MKIRSKKALRALAAVLVIAMMLMSLASCSNSDTPGTNDDNPPQSNPGDQGNKDDQGTGTGGGGTQNPEGYPAGKNTDNSFAMPAIWPATGLIHHFDSTTSCNVFNVFVVEGLWGYVRTTDETYPMLASEMPTYSKESLDDYKDVIGEDLYDYFKENNCDTVTVATGHIRPEAKWSNGEDFTAKDVWSYYYIVQPATTNYLAGVKVVDDKTVQFIWNPLKEPVDRVKTLLMCQDICGTVKYDIFAQYVDTAYGIVMASEVNRDLDKSGAFGRIRSDEQNTELTQNRQEFYACDPDWYVSTGPFKLDTFSETQILLTKNEYHWAADNIGFEKVKLYSYKDLTQLYQMLVDGVLDHYWTFVQSDSLESILAQNEDLVNLKVYDAGCIGLLFNLKNPILSDVRVRQALEYVFDRESVTKAANPFAPTSYFSAFGMPPTDALDYMSPENYKKLTVYSYDPEKAAQLLTDIGWEKKDGLWYANGEPVEFTMATDNSHPVSVMSAEASTAQLEAFGIKCNLLQLDNPTYWSTAAEEDAPYDIYCCWTDLNGSFLSPAGPITNFNNTYSKWSHLEHVDGKISLVFDGLDGDTQKYSYAEYYDKLYYLDEDEQRYIADVFNLGFDKMCLGVQFFQNVTTVTWNVAHISGVPLQEYWLQDRNVTHLPQPGDDDFMDTQRTNMGFSKELNFYTGAVQPNKAE